jgi:hypothetical protein
MVYNLVKYLLDNSSLTEIYANGFQAKSGDDCLTVKEGPTDERDWFNRQDQTIQILSRAKVKDNARKQLIEIRTLINKKYGLTFPLINVNGVDYPEIKTWACRPVSGIQYAGDDDKGRHVFSVYFDITTTI